MGVPVVRDLPGVGKNLHNHVAYTLTFTINDTDTTPLNWATAMEYLLFRDGLMSGTGKAVLNIYSIAIEKYIKRSKKDITPISICQVFFPLCSPNETLSRHDKFADRDPHL